MKQRVLFVCIHNSARSQMAEELLRKLAGGRFDVESAGLEPGRINPYAQKVLAEAGIDISKKETKSVSKMVESSKIFDYVITVCDETSAERCPVFPGKSKRIHWSFRDPSQFQGSDEQKLQKTREVREEINTRIKKWLQEVV